MAFSKHADSGSLTKTDMLSNLPEGVKEQILTYLPIKEAGRTSILSTKWRYTWASIPELEISHSDIFSNHGHGPLDDSYYEIVNFVDTIFLLRRGPIRRLDLFLNLSCFAAFDRWIINLSRNEIREIILELCCSGFYIIHSSFFSCDALHYIDLCQCRLKVPRYFKGFKLLHTLILTFLEISDDDLEKLVSSSPLLKSLTLVDLNDMAKFTFLKIRAPNLECLEIECEFSNLEVCAPKLHYLCVEKLDPPENQNNSFAQFFGDKPDLQALIMKGHILSDLCAKPLVGEFSSTFDRLKHLEFELDFEDKTKASFILAIFQKASNLQSLVIHVNLPVDRPISPSMTFWENIDGKEDLFKQLQKVKIVNFRALISTISFVKFILGSAPRLLALTLKMDSDYVEDNRIMFEHLMSFSRASPKVYIKI